jgi:hypothetical protein
VNPQNQFQKKAPSNAGAKGFHMQTIQQQALACNPVPSQSDSHREFLLAEIRCLSLRAKLTANELDSVGVALRGGFIDAECAVEWIDEIGLLNLVRAPERRP